MPLSAKFGIVFRVFLGFRILFSEFRILFFPFFLFFQNFGIVFPDVLIFLFGFSFSEFSMSVLHISDMFFFVF